MKNRLALFLLVVMLAVVACKKKGAEIIISSPVEDAVFDSGTNNVRIEATITDKKGVQAYTMSITNLTANTTTVILDETAVAKSTVTIDKTISLTVKGQANYQLKIEATNVNGTASSASTVLLVKE